MVLWFNQSYYRLPYPETREDKNSNQGLNKLDFMTLFLSILRRLYNNPYTEERSVLGKATWPCNSDIRLDEVVTRLVM